MRRSHPPAGSTSPLPSHLTTAAPPYHCCSTPPLLLHLSPHHCCSTLSLSLLLHSTIAAPPRHCCPTPPFLLHFHPIAAAPPRHCCSTPHLITAAPPHHCCSTSPLHSRELMLHSCQSTLHPRNHCSHSPLLFRALAYQKWRQTCCGLICLPPSQVVLASPLLSCHHCPPLVSHHDCLTGDDSTYYAMRPQLFEMLSASHPALPAYVDGLLTHEVVHGSSEATRASFGLQVAPARLSLKNW